VGGGEKLLRVPTFLSAMVRKKNLKKITPLAVKQVREKGSCTVLQVQLTSATKKKQHATTSFTWVGK